MRTEKEKMLTGQLYDASDPVLLEERRRAQRLCRELQLTDPRDDQGKARLLAELFGNSAPVDLTPPFHCDYGYNIKLGKKVYFNFNCVVLDVMPVSIGDNVLIGPAAQIYTAMHSMDAAERKKGLEFGKSVTIENDVWIGGGCIICPGVTIGRASVIGAGSVVTRSIPKGVFAAGNPCRVVRTLSNTDI